MGLWAGTFKGSHIMMVDFDLELTGVREPHLKHVLERRPGSWKVIAAQNTFVAGR